MEENMIENMIENVIEVQDIRKSFKVFYDKGNQLKERVLFRNRNRYEKRLVLDGISFQIKRGEAVGLIGHNGCGKSTVLKLLTRIIYPDSGSIKINGRVSSLIELGAGFHPDMSGRENIYINAAIFGLTRKEINQRIKNIVRFAELEEFIDNPVRTYSSGMYMRLAFSVAIHVDADVLLIDEILAVGDVGFQRKCFEKLKEIKNKETTIVIVSHSLSQIEQICERSIWIENGKIREEGIPKYVHDDYLMAMENKRIDRFEQEQREGATDSGSSQAGEGKRDTVDSGSSQAGRGKRGTTDPGSQAGRGKRGTTDPGSSQIGKGKRGTTDPGSSQIGKGKRGTTDPGGDRIGKGDATDSGGSQAGERDAMDSGSGQTGKGDAIGSGSGQTGTGQEKVLPVPGHPAKDGKGSLPKFCLQNAVRMGNHKVEFTNVEILDADGEERYGFRTEDAMDIVLSYQSNVQDLEGNAGIGIFRDDGVYCFGTNIDIEEDRLIKLKKCGKIRIRIKKLPLLYGTYYLDVAIHSKDSIEIYDDIRKAKKFQVFRFKKDDGLLRIQTEWDSDG